MLKINFLTFLIKEPEKTNESSNDAELNENEEISHDHDSIIGSILFKYYISFLYMYVYYY